MGASKTELFTEEQNLVAAIAKALGHPARVAIVEHLLKVNGCICSDIVGEVPLSQPTISQHLRELRDAEIITGTIEGNAICYCLNRRTIEKLQSYVAAISAKLMEGGKNCC